MTATTDRNKLIETALPLVAWQSRRFRNLPAGVNVEDLESAGHEALLEAATLYDPASGIEFKTFARTTVRSRMATAIEAARRVARRTRALEVRTADGAYLPRADRTAAAPGDIAAARETGRSLATRRRSPEDIAAELPTPAVVAEKVRTLRAALFAGLTADDAGEVMAAVVGKAKFGDLRAARLFLDLLGATGPNTVVNNTTAVQVNNR